MRLPQSFYQRDAASLARVLLGQRLVRIHDGQRLAGTIVETEAYLGVHDWASHTFGGRRTPRVEAMWGPPGTAYVYFTYGMHHCVNVTAENPDDPGNPEAVLIRALEPTEGLADMRTRRIKAKRDTDLCSGPAKLTQALAIDRSLDGTDLLTAPHFSIEAGAAVPEGKIVATPRIGIASAGDWVDRPLRFFIAGNPHVSR